MKKDSDSVINKESFDQIPINGDKSGQFVTKSQVPTTREKRGIENGSDSGNELDMGFRSFAIGFVALVAVK
ncbi:unnamed protein product [Ilex paraguariensis]|uniref:Uncharacterized protein n=1 Tax=Ilex paraguariensis TaxID=185542 RepID=A0ABC8R402_9AQUA